MLVRRILAAGALVALVVLHFDYKLILFAVSDRGHFRRIYTEKPDRGWHDYPQFLEGVRAHTNPGDRIALIVPTTQWEGGYSYAYFRASYLLSGRAVLPLLYGSDDPIAENLDTAKYLAIWRGAPPPGTIVWEGAGGVLLRPR